MTRWLAFGLALFVVVPEVGATGPTAILEIPEPMSRPGSFHRGASIGFFLKERGRFYEAVHYAELIERALASGVTDLQLVVRWFQGDVASSQISRGEGDTVSDDVLRDVIHYAKRRGLRVFLMPFVFVRDNRDGSWRGAIAPLDPDGWWASYRTYIMHYAGLAEQEKVSLFSVGSELKSLVDEEPRWRALIEEVRAVYSGRLIYSANWDNYEAVHFWDVLDVLGVNGYFSLSRRHAPGLDELRFAWSEQRDRLRHWAGGLARRFVLTEVGYRSSVIAPAEPWNHFDMPAPAPSVQLKCYRALFDTWVHDRALGGLYTWNWYGEGGLDEAGFSPFGKPASELLRHWFFGSRSL